MLRILQSGWMTMLLGTLSYLGVTAVLLSPNKFAGMQTEAGPDAGTFVGASWEFFNPEVDRLIADLQREKQAVELRARQLDELAVRLEAERAELNQVTQTVQRLQVEFDRNMLRVGEQETANLKKLAKIYATMAPEAATRILSQMEDDKIAKIMMFMKEAETAPILETISQLGKTNSHRAAALSQRLGHALPPAPASKP